ncbi:MAG: hypothetical protein GY940_15165, partial [bacterium]|nr:hypothetical protein [bacterium]
KNTWNRLIMAADNTPYNPDVITKLEELDYTNFQMDRSATINKGVFEAVAGFLQKGDTRGVYKKLLMDIEALQRRVNVIKTDLENLRFPELKDLWGLNQTFSNTMLFGQYVAEVFYSIQENR